MSTGFDYYETGLETGVPITLYVFKSAEDSAGNVSYLCYTDCEVEVEMTFAAGLFATTATTFTFAPIPISRTEISATGTMDRTASTVKLPRTTDLVNLFQVYPPSFVVQTWVFEGHYGDPLGGYNMIFFGRTLNCAIDGMVASMTLEPLATSIKRRGANRFFQYPCPHVLYGSKCKAVEKTTSATIASVSGSIMVVSLAVAVSDIQVFDSGVLKWRDSDDVLTVLSILGVSTVSSGTQLIVSGYASNIPVGSTVTLVWGCDLTYSTCTSRFNNILNYGGMPWIPTENPIGKMTTFL